jgi:predicted nucleic acid-binding protein
MIYADSNVFVQAILNKSDKGRRAQAFLKRVHSGEVEACTSHLTWDELSWAVLANRGQSAAVEASRAFLKISNLRFIDVSREVLERAEQIMATYGLHPRDAIHAASAIGMGAEMLSEDKDFDRVKGLKRRGL